MNNNTLVIGGTGTVGSAVVSELMQVNANFSVLTRNDEKASKLNSQGIPAVVGALGEWPTLEPLLEKIDTIFLATSPASNMLDLHKGFIDLAVKHKVKKIVRLSAEPANYPEGLYMYEQHAAADEYLKTSGLNYVILRPHYFMQNIMAHLDYIKSQSRFAQYSGGAKIPMIHVADIAKAAVQGLTKEEFNNQTFVLTGPVSISYADIATILSDVLGKEVQYIDLPYEEQEAGFKAFGMEDWQLNTVMRLLKHWADNGSVGVSPDFKKITGSDPTHFETFCKQIISVFEQA